jgi:hypothetical protein
MEASVSDYPDLVKLRLFSGATQDPKLTDDELGVLLAQWAVRDADGLAPTDDGWVPTHLLAGAIADAWRAKAAAASSRAAFSADGSSFQRDQVFRHCMQMADRYAAQAAQAAAGLPGGGLTRPFGGMKADRPGGDAASRTVTL